MPSRSDLLQNNFSFLNQRRFPDFGQPWLGARRPLRSCGGTCQLWAAMERRMLALRWACSGDHEPLLQISKSKSGTSRCKPRFSPLPLALPFPFGHDHQIRVTLCLLTVGGVKSAGSWNIFLLQTRKAGSKRKVT